MMRRVLVLLGLLLVTVACCNGKKLWGVDVGNKEEVSDGSTRQPEKKIGIYCVYGR